jgi:peptidoglycan/xylan/chitin deacetylase (PgdA/CDA1 family)
MNSKLMIVWDYDSAIGQINSTLPYNFSYYQIFEEIKNVEYILAKAEEADFKMTFACVGFDAEEGIFPFNNPEQIKRIFGAGHEIASHSWRHEAFQYLTGKQIYKSLERSKYILEKCLGNGGTVNGFVPPHSRPMSWYKKFSFSMGDRTIYPVHKGADMGYIIKQLSLLNYKWCRVLKSYKPVWKKALSNSGQDNFDFGKWEIHNGIVCVPQHYTGFDGTARKYLEKAILEKESIVIVAHPAALSREGAESSDNFERFIDDVNEYRSKKQLDVMTVNDYISENILNDRK